MRIPDEPPVPACIFQVHHGGQWRNYWSGPAPQEFLDDEGGAEAFLLSMRESEDPIRKPMRILRLVPEVLAELPGL